MENIHESIGKIWGGARFVTEKYNAASADKV